MDKIKKRYLRLFLIFALMVGGIAFFIKHEINSMEEAQKKQEIKARVEQIAQEQEEQMENSGPRTSEIDYSFQMQDALNQMGQNPDFTVEALENFMLEGEPLQKAKGALTVATLYEEKNEIDSAIRVLEMALDDILNIDEEKEVHERIAKLSQKRGLKSTAAQHYEDIYLITRETSDFHNMAEMYIELNNISKLKMYLEEHEMLHPESSKEMEKYTAWLDMMKNMMNS